MFKELHTIHLTVYTRDVQYVFFSTDNHCLLQPIIDENREFYVYICIVLKSQYKSRGFCRTESCSDCRLNNNTWNKVGEQLYYFKCMGMK